MRRFVPILLALLFTASACFGESGAWRCADGTACAFTPGVGFHCPGMSPASHDRNAAKATQGFCPLCRKKKAETRTHAAASSSPCAAVCRSCQCHYVSTSLRVPAVTTVAAGIAAAVSAEHPALLPSLPCPTVGFVTRPVIFTTGPPDYLPAASPSPVSSRAPPRLLFA